MNAGLSFPESHLSDVRVRRLCAGWLLLAVTALAFAIACALLLTIGRTPWLSALKVSGDFFGRALVVHVTLAVVIWFLSFAAAFWTLAARSIDSTWLYAMQCLALALAVTGTGVTVASLGFDVRPVLANYFPVLDDRIFLMGLSLFGIGVALAAVSVAKPVWVEILAQGEPWHLGAMLSMIVIAVVGFAWVASLDQIGAPSTNADFEHLAWGPGHALQFVHILLLMSVWIVLSRQLTGYDVAPQPWLSGLLALAAFPVVAVPFIYLQFPVNSYEFRNAFTLLMSWGTWPAPAVLSIVLLRQLLALDRDTMRTPPAVALLLSVLLFIMGCALGAMIQNDSTMVPAHYHGTVGAITLAYMALGYRLVAGVGDGVARSISRLQPLLYGSGLMTLALALAWSGSIGVPRKTLHAEVLLQHPEYLVAMSLAGIGGVLAIAGASLFVVDMLRELFYAAKGRAHLKQSRDMRWQAIGVTVGATLLFGWGLSYWTPDAGEPAGTAALHAARARADEVRKHFDNGVSYLRDKQFDKAMVELHRVLELEPKMPEAHVNMGFAMVGLNRFDAARDFFNTALVLNVNQRNAYYGLGIALERLHDVQGAMGAMQTYVHLSEPDDPYRQKAETALLRLRGTLPPRPTVQ